MKESRGSFTLIDQHQRWVKGLSQSAGVIHWEKRPRGCVGRRDKKLMIFLEESDDLKEDFG